MVTLGVSAGLALAFVMYARRNLEIVNFMERFLLFGAVTMPLWVITEGVLAGESDPIAIYAGVGIGAGLLVLSTMLLKRMHRIAGINAGVLLILTALLLPQIQSLSVDPASASVVEENGTDLWDVARATQTAEAAFVSDTPVQVVQRDATPTPRTIAIAPTMTPTPFVIDVTRATPVPPRAEDCSALVTANLRLREDPADNGDLILTMPEGSAVRVLAQNPAGDWYRVRFGTDEGWAFADLLERDAVPTCDDLPVWR